MRYGEIELSSGRWTWTVAELDGHGAGSVAGARADGETERNGPDGGQTVLLLEDPMDPEDWMTRELPRRTAAEEIPDEELKALAADPDRRTLHDPDGTVWKIEPIDRPEPIREDAEFERAPRKVRVSANGGQERTLSLPDERPLGAVSSEELISLVHV